jgi:WD40 repeat protein
MRLCLFVLVCAVGWLVAAPVAAQTNPIVEVCKGDIQPRPAEFTPSGIILTSFDGAALWVYDIARTTRYPLPETRPCLTNCRLSPDARWLIYPNPENMVFTRMRLDGTEREPLFGNAVDVLWWSPDTYLIWTMDHRAYLQPLDSSQPNEELPVSSIINVQPGGRWGVLLELYNGEFWRALVDLTTRDFSGVPTANEARIYLAPDTPYFNAGVWSPDGVSFVYVGLAPAADNGVSGAELFQVQPGTLPQQITQFSTGGAPVRIGGYNAASLFWSPDGRRIAFWVTPLTGSNPETDTGEATIHMLDVTTGQVTKYCGFATSDHTPNPSRLIWSPDGSTIAFAGNVPGDNKGSLLLALDVATGTLTELSDGIFPALGLPDVVAWGTLP